ncbi:shieldin complex subunit 2 [Bombina bombina]|uniref:shieldin complex subunit 2 n=1 Tax=Bombina bombina TaxID=8345 RepID=UPI00235A7209|nr:shieldin complex subunit 2 [Bombina bombina]
MSNKGIIHIFVGAPVIPSPSNDAEDDDASKLMGTWHEQSFVWSQQDLFAKCSIPEARKYHDISELGNNLKEQDLSLNAVNDSLPLKQQTLSSNSETKNRGTQCVRDILDLVSSTHHCQITPPSQTHSNDLFGANHECLSQYLEDSFPRKQEQLQNVKTPSITIKISTTTEYHTILMSSQVAVFGHAEIYEQDANIEQKETNNSGPSRELKSAVFTPFISQESRVLNKNAQDSNTCSVELFTPSTNDVQNNLALSLEPTRYQKNGNVVEFSEKFIDDSSKITEPDGARVPSSKRLRACEEVTVSFHAHYEKQQQSKKAKKSISPEKLEYTSLMRKFMLLKPAKELSFLQHCSSKSKEYNVLVIVVQPCHIKEVHVKTGPNGGSSVALATIVVLDQSEVERKVVLWREAAFWTLAVYPGDVLMLTGVSVCEDKWHKETILQSTSRSCMLNLGSCSNLCSQDISHMVDNTALHSLLQYISAKHCYLRELPPKQPQKLDHISYVHLDQLQPDMLIHSILKVSSISMLTECTYQYKGQRQKKVILTLEEVKGHTGIMVLWGACISWCDQIQHKRDHIWEFRNLFVRKNSVSGEIELHTTPWSSCECLFDDDERAVDFKKRYFKNEEPLTKLIDLPDLLEERYSGEALVKASISELEFLIPGHHNIVMDQDTTLTHILALLPAIIYSGCGKCRREIGTDHNQVFEQCLFCLPFNQVKKFYRPARITAVSGESGIRIHVPSDALDKILLNISPTLLDKAVVSSSEVTYRYIVADLIHSLLAGTSETHLLTIRSRFNLDENSIPLEQDFFLLDFHLNL